MCDKYRKLKNSKISYVFDKTLVLYIACGKCGSGEKKLRKKNQSRY